MSAAPSIDSDKRTMRVAAIACRKATFAAQPAAGEWFAERFLAIYPLPRGTAISAYWPMGSELDVRPLLRRLHEGGKVCMLPVVVGRDRPLVFRRWQPGTRLVEGGFRVLTPGPEAAEGVPSVVLCPLLAFDRRGYRLGYGGGYYDRTVRALRADGSVTALGVGFAAQEVPAVPRTATDQRLDGIVTELGAVPLKRE